MKFSNGKNTLVKIINLRMFKIIIPPLLIKHSAQGMWIESVDNPDSKNCGFG